MTTRPTRPGPPAVHDSARPTQHSALRAQHSALGSQHADFGARLAPVELRVDSFEGPLELLLNLIEKRKLPVTAVSLAAVADQYLAYVRSLPELDPDLLSDFLVVAAKLLLVKSRAILPGQDEPADGLEDDDPAEDLAARLEAYRLIRAAAEHLQGLEQRGMRCYPHHPRPFEVAGPAPLQPIEPTELRAALTRLLQRRLRTSVNTAEMEVLVRASVETRMGLILERLSRSSSVAWDNIAGQSVDEMVASFLALLELVKRGQAVAEQERLFGPIVIRRPSP